MKRITKHPALCVAWLALSWICILAEITSPDPAIIISWYAFWAANALVAVRYVNRSLKKLDL